MSSADATNLARGPRPLIPLDALVADASRQLNVCNACRYCEGLCAVFPALERRTLLTADDVSQLSNLCHDCRACFDACMYTPPHEFAVNVPAALSRVRVADYERHVWPQRVPRVFSGWPGVFSGGLTIAIVLLVIALVNAGPARLVSSDGVPISPYDLIPYPVMLVLILLPFVFSVVVMAAAARNYWRAVNSACPIKVTGRAVLRATGYAATLRYLRGGGSDCYYPEDDQPSKARRWLHYLVVVGFGLCIVSTVAAGVLQDLLGEDPPYGWLSAPVLTGTVGGVLLVAGSVGLFVLKTRSSEVTAVAEMTIKDYGLIVALAFLGASGLVVLFTRDTGAYGIVLLVHLSSVLLAFAIAPYTKFVHVVFRFLALVRDEGERTQSAAVPDGTGSRPATYSPAGK